jgi:hypothetical protein
LKQDKWDMKAHRFTWVEQNLVVAATDFEDYDDRKNLDETDEVVELCVSTACSFFYVKLHSTTLLDLMRLHPVR